MLTDLERNKGGMTENLPSKAIPEGEDLHGCVVMTCSVLELQELVSELRDQRDAQANLINSQLEVLKAFSDLYLELTDESEQRQFLSKAILKAEREAARLRLPTWFWRPEKDKPLKDLLFWRARFLIHRQQAHLDDVWDLLREFVADYARADISDEELTAIIEQAHEVGVD